MSKFSYQKKEEVLNKEIDTFWDTKETQREITIDPKNMIEISLASKTGKTYILIQKKYLSAGGDWKNGKGFSMEFNEFAGDVFKAAAKLCGDYSGK